MNDLNYKLNKYYNKIYNNYIIYSSYEFQKKWISNNNCYNNICNAEVFIRNLVDEIANINKNLLKSLFIFSIKNDFLYLSNLIYEKDKNEFTNPLLTKKTQNIKINFKKNNKKFIISSCFTPPNEHFLNLWNKKKIIDNLDNYI